MRLSEIFVIEENVINNERGAGNTPNNSNVDYMGLRVMMKPSVFLELALRLSSPTKGSMEFIEKSIRDGTGIASPFLDIDIEATEEDANNPATVKSHEGRHRCNVMMKMFGDKPIEVHLFFRGGVRARDLTPAIIKSMQKQLISQRGLLVKSNKLFDVKK